MNYELVKQLKEAGFPSIELCNNCLASFIGKHTHIIKEPSLAELIKICSNRMFASFSLEQHSNDWRAGNYRSKDFLDFTTGSTPEEAVAKLWLSLHQK